MPGSVVVAALRVLRRLLPLALPLALALPAPAATPADAATASPDARAPADEQRILDVCGIGQVPVPAGDPPDLPPDHAMLQAAARLEPRWTAALAIAGERTRAAARLTGLAEAPPGAATAVPAAMAEASTDPVIAAWALDACGRDTACIRAAARRWLALEPGNLAPRLWLLDEAQPPGLAALQSLATADRHQVHRGQLGPALLQAWPDGEARFLLTELLVSAIGVEAAMSLQFFDPLVRACRDGAAEAGPRSACQRIARTLMRHGDTLMAASVGATLGRDAGLPAAETEAVRQAIREAGRVAEPFARQFAEQPWSCSTHTLLLDEVAEVRRHGEWGALQRRLQARPSPR